MQTKVILRTLNVQLRRWSNDRRGATAIIFGLAVIPLLFAIGLAIDSARAYRTSDQLSAALDVASLATAKALRLQGLDDGALLEVAKKYFKQNLIAQGASEADYGELQMTADHVANKVTLKAAAILPTTIGRLMNINQFNLPATSTAVYDAKNVELSMMLDVSGSMSGSKIEDLKTSAKDLIKIILTANAGGAEHRIGIAPYSTALNAGAYSNKAKGGPDKTTCVTERPGNSAFNDDDPKGRPLGKKAGWCPVATIAPLSDNIDQLDTAVDAMQAAGGTAGHLGVAWAWYLLSPNWSDVWPSESVPKAYDDTSIAKTAILMTDGMFNKEYESSNGSSAEQALKLCSGMKSAGVTVYTIGFQAPPEALTLLQECASSPEHAFDAQNGAQLNATFKDIANRLTSLRIAG